VPGIEDLEIADCGFDLRLKDLETWNPGNLRSRKSENPTIPRSPKGGDPMKKRLTEYAACAG
jgi:hypothetical protein